MADKEKLQAIKDEIERRIKNVSLILNICNTEDLTKEEFGYHVEQETLKSLLIFINSFQEYPSPKFKIGNTIRDKEGKTGAFTITDIKVEDKSLVYLGNKRQKVSIWCQDDYEIVNNDLLVKENPASKDLEESSKHYLLSGHISPLNDILHQAALKTEMQYHKDIEDAFKAGAEWQKQKDEELFSEDIWNYIEENYPNITEEEKLRLYDVSIKSRLAGADTFKKHIREEMMKNAVECVVEDWCGDSPEITIPLNPQDFKMGDKVKIIIVKED